MRIKIDKSKRLHLACSTDKLRPVLQCVKVQGSKLIATDGSILAVIETEVMRDGSDPDELLINKEVVKEATKGNKNNEAFVDVTEDETSCFTIGENKKLFLPQDQDLSYPRWENVVPPDTIKYAHHVIRLDAKLLYTLQQALGGNALTLYFPFNNREAIVVTAKEGIDDTNGEFGLIMPIRME